MVEATLALTELADVPAEPPEVAVACASRPWTSCVSLFAASAAAATALGTAGCIGGGPDGPLTAPLPVPLAVPLAVLLAVASELAAAAVAWLFAST